MQTWTVVSLALLLLLLPSLCIGERILILALPFMSHTKYQTNLARGLSASGHEVWVTMPWYLLKVKERFDLTGVHVLPTPAIQANVEEDSMRILRDYYFAHREHDLLGLVWNMLNYTDTLLRDTQFFEDVKQIQPELLIIDNLPYFRVMSVLAYKLDIPFVYVGLDQNKMMNRIPSVTSLLMLQSRPYSDHPTFAQRLIMALEGWPGYLFHICEYSDSVARYAPEKPPMDIFYLQNKAEVTLVETDHVLDYPRVSIPNVKFIGGLAVVPAKPLKDPFKTFIESTPDNVDIIVVSFGSYVVNLPPVLSQKLVNVFRALPYRVIWRVNMTSPSPDKVMTSQWIPQNDLLAQPKVKVFVSHCGQNGQYEALYNAVPTLCLPLFADQFYNAERTRVKGFSLTSDLNTVSEDELVTLIRELHDNATYSKAIQRASRLFQELYGIPSETAVYWINHVIQYGGSYMRYAGQDLSWREFYNVDVYAVFLGVAAVGMVCLYGILWTVWRLAWCCLSLLLSRNSSSGTDKVKSH